MRKTHLLSVITVLFLLTFSCTNICKSYLENIFRPLEYEMVITGKYINTRFFRIIGREPSGVIDTTEQSAIIESDYYLIEIGDSLIKKKNSLDILIVKNDTTIITTHFCY